MTVSEGRACSSTADRADPADRAIRVSETNAAGPIWIIGDLHGDLLALETALALIGREAERESTPAGIIFLGDLFDDEGFGLEVLIRVFEIVLEAPERACVIAGNHDVALSYDGVRFDCERVSGRFFRIPQRQPCP